MVKQPTVISTFAGCGGSSLGYKMAGFKELLAVEWEKNAIDTFKLNFPDVPVYQGDIAKLTSDECMTLAGIKSGELDVFDGSPPCQGFSRAGKRKLEDPRNSLFKEYVRLLFELQPKVFVMENVLGMINGAMKQVYLQIVQALRDCGYRVKGEVLNSMYYGVPQSRQRVILIGVRNDLNIPPTHPKPQTMPISVKKAIGHFPIGNQGKHEQQIIDAWHKAKPNQALRKACPFVSSFQSFRLDPNKPSPTQIKAHLNWHYSIPRQLTIQEAGCIQSFPDTFIFSGSKTQSKERIGNSVPPLLMKAIAEHIKGNILSQ